MLTRKDISIVVVTHNRLMHLRETLSKLTSLHNDSPIIVVDNNSNDGTGKMLNAEFPDVQIIELSKNRGTGARTLGVNIAHTPLVAFNDDDSWLAKDALAKAAEIFNKNPRLGLIAARVLVGKGKKLDPVCMEMQNSPLKNIFPRASFKEKGIPVLGFLACGSIVCKQAFLDVSGFEENFGIGGEEQMLAVDLAVAGWEVSYFDEIVAYHHPQIAGERPERKQIMIRNDLWSAWLRRPIHVAVSKTMRVLRNSFSRSDSKKALLAALKGMGWVMKKRRRVTPFIEYCLVLLEKAKLQH